MRWPISAASERPRTESAVSHTASHSTHDRHTTNIGSSSCDLRFDKNSSTRQELNIVTACDEHYAQHVSVMLLSLMEHNKHYVVNAFVLIPQDMQESTLDRIRQSILDFSSNLTFIKTNSNVMKSLKVCGYLTSAAYYKLLIGELLPRSLQKVIYLDADIVVRGRLDELWNFPLGDSIVGAADHYNSPAPAPLGLRPSEPYYNTGVLLVD